LRERCEQEYFTPERPMMVKLGLCRLLRSQIATSLCETRGSAHTNPRFLETEQEDDDDYILLDENKSVDVDVEVEVYDGRIVKIPAYSEVVLRNTNINSDSFVVRLQNGIYAPDLNQRLFSVT
jgi:hypothetical protein